jgi:hypothetical protein
MSEASPPRDAAWRPSCPNHLPEEPPMESAILKMNYPAGWLPVRGFRCPKCGEDAIMAEESAAAAKLAKELGLFGTTDRRNRKVLKTGGSLAVSIDPELARRVFGELKPGDTVSVGLQGGRIVIEPASSET